MADAAGAFNENSKEVGRFVFRLDARAGAFARGVEPAEPYPAVGALAVEGDGAGGGERVVEAERADGGGVVGGLVVPPEDAADLAGGLATGFVRGAEAEVLKWAHDAVGEL